MSFGNISMRSYTATAAAAAVAGDVGGARF